MCVDAREGVPCRNYECKHNMFYRGLRLGSRFKETELSLSWNNCDKKIRRRCKLREVAEMWGMTKERVRQIEMQALVSLYIAGTSFYKKEVSKNG